MNKHILLGTTLVCALTVLSACGGKSGGNKIDATKTQLYLYSYDGGYGSDWLRNAGKRFEDTVKDVSFEEGKTGVQIIVNADKTNSAVTSIASFNSGTNDIYFTEGVAYNNFIASDNPLLDLTDVINETNSYDGKKIIDKLNDQYKNYYNRDGHYYALPHYAGYYGFAYSIELFDKYGAYIGTDGKVISNRPGVEKGMGPNGKTGVIDGVDYSYDDGLPATYDQFFTVCNFLNQKGVSPYELTGQYAVMHLNALFRALAADADGASTVRVKSTFDGEITAVKVDANNNPLFSDGEGGETTDGEELLTERVQVSPSVGNRHNIYRSAGTYYAASFMSRLMQYLPADGTNETVTHLDAQSNFIYSNTQLAQKDNSGLTHNYAMLVDGPWWESEGRDFFDKSVNRLKDEAYSRKNRKFGWMPLPKPTEELVGQKNCILDHLESAVIARKSKSEERNELIKEFIRFIHQDQELVNFAADTGVKRNLIYDIDTTTLENCSSYVKSLLKYSSDCDAMYPGVQDTYYINNYDSFTGFTSLKNYFATSIKGNTVGAGEAFLNNSDLTPNEWFKTFYSSKTSL
ncbi:MAG: ABC transporter substrate-binding protein [Bacilli bacterium]|nr:ABC transporter substrate-binding protein [Bacilli bacterium]